MKGQNLKIRCPPFCSFDYKSETHGAAVCLADVQSANVVGYNTTTLLPNDYTMFGVQFEGIGGEGVKFGDLKGNFFGGPSVTEADNIMVWKDGAYHYYYYGVWGDPDYPEWDNLWYNQEDMDASEETIDPGIACWYLRMSDATTMSFASPLAK